MTLLDRETFRRLCVARDLLRDDGETPLSVREVAHHVTISPHHFIRRFEAVFGATPHQFRTRWRLDRAKRLLALGNHSVTETCMAVGFSSVGSFSSLFRRRVGASPSAYRRRMRAFAPAPGTMPPALDPGCLTLMGRVPPTAFRAFGEARPHGHA